ncbi:peroxiredoxin [uncultured Aquitalea sp.]|uniref:peroxiredoxin n=1 Tax=uncultured Aquitalea sp. TaxID=540272 RepID=UPI0025EBE308|nr:peroxiredoxin [uncultured Aquitalea sp.]
MPLSRLLRLLPLCAALTALPAAAALVNGAIAPDFTTTAAKGGDSFRFSLYEALKQGPVILYFYPAAFTSGCTVEAHLFAEATDRFKALGATVIGVSNDNIDTLKRFSVSECRSKFAVAADGDKAIMKAYDAVMVPGLGYASRTSYVITPDHKVIYSWTALDPNQHVENTMKALEAWKAGKQP